MMFRLLATSVLASTLALPAHADMHFGFDTGVQAWSVLFDGAMSHVASGGNPGGFLRMNDIDTKSDFELLAPAGLLGNQSALLGGSLSFDARNPFNITPDWPEFGYVTLKGAGKTLVFDAAPVDGQPAMDGLWHTYSVGLTVANFGPDLPSVLAGLTQLSIKTEFHQGLEDIIDIDNIHITAVPEPASWALLLAGGLVLPALRRRLG